MVMLDERLQTVARLVRKDAYFCDVGTDHCYLPCYLVQQGITRRCVACDINIMPLQSAQKQVESQHLTDCIEVILSDGLDSVSPDVDDIAIAGMGGELIAEIIGRCEFVKIPSKRLILQAMTNAPHLRRELYRMGFEIMAEIPVIDQHHTYSVMQVRYSGGQQEISKMFSVLGKITESRDTAAVTYIDRILDKVGKIISGLQRSTNEDLGIEDYIQLAHDIERKKEEMLRHETC